MGATVVFWSPVAGQAGTTTSLLAAAACLGMEYSTRLLVLGHLQSGYAALERGFYYSSAIRDNGGGSDMGIDALLRLLQTRKLEPGLFRNYTLPLLRDRLDLLPGSGKSDTEAVFFEEGVLASLLATARQAYDLVFMDGGSGYTSLWTNVLQAQADILVVCLPQNRLVLEQYFHSSNPPGRSETKKLLVFGQYDSQSALTVKNILRQFRQQKPAYPIPHHSGWLDAVQHGDAIPFMFRNRQTTQPANRFFMQQVRQLAQALIVQAGLDPAFFGRKEEGSR